MNTATNNPTTRAAFNIIDSALDALTSDQVETLVLAAAAQICARRGRFPGGRQTTRDPGEAERVKRYRDTAGVLLAMGAEGCEADSAAELVKLY